MKCSSSRNILNILFALILCVSWPLFVSRELALLALHGDLGLLNSTWRCVRPIAQCDPQDAQEDEGKGQGSDYMIGLRLLARDLVNGFKWTPASCMTACICLTVTGRASTRSWNPTPRPPGFMRRFQLVLHHVRVTCVQIRCPLPGL